MIEPNDKWKWWLQKKRTTAQRTKEEDNQKMDSEK